MISKFTNFKSKTHIVEFRMDVSDVARNDSRNPFYVGGDIEEGYVTIELLNDLSDKEARDILHKKSLWMIKNLDKEKTVIYEVVE